MHMKKTKFAMLLVMVLVFALQSVGMMPAGAEETHAPITSSKWYAKDVSLTNLVGYMGPVSQYGVITEHYIQGGHSEANVFADKITRENGRTDPFLASGDTVNATKDSHVQATLTLPEVHVADEMTFGLFYLDDSGNLVEVAHEGSNHRITVDVAGQTAVQLVFPAVTCHDHMMENLYIRQIEKGLPVDPQNTDGMKITYGPPVISERRNALYLGDITYTGDDVFNLFQNADDVGVCDVMELGTGIKLYRKTGDNTFEPITPGTGVGEDIKEIFIHDDSWPADAEKPYKIINNLIFGKDGKFKLSESKYEIDVVYLEKPAEGEKNKAEELLDNLAELSYKLSNSELGIGGALKDGMKLGDLPVEGGNSTVTGSTEDGAVLSLYHAGLTATSTSKDYYVDMSMLAPTSPQTGWANGGLPIADNEYVIINVVVGGPDGVLHLNDQGLELSLRNSDGTQHKTNMWRSVSNLSFSRVIWNPVYWDEGSKSYQPFQGTVLAGNTHGGVVLAPYADIDQPSVGDSVTLIGESVHNSNGQEIHQTSFQGARTFVRMINEPTTEVWGEKIWQGDKESDRPAKIEITLWIVKEGGNVAVATHEVTPDADGKWIWSFTNLPKVQDGKAIEYTITERPVSHYDAPVVGQQTEEANGNDRIITQNVTNTYNPDLMVVAGQKIWNDGNDQDGIRPDAIKVTLLSRWGYWGYDVWTNRYTWIWTEWEPHATTLSKIQEDTDHFNKVDHVTVTEADNWSWVFDNLPAKTRNMGSTFTWEYKVEETTVDGKPVIDGYTTEYSNDGDHTDNPDGEYNIINTHRPSKISIKGSKFWLDDNNELKTRPNDAQFEARRKIEGGEWEEAKDISGNKLHAQVTEEKGWSWEFKDVPAYDANGNLYTYEVYEVNPNSNYWPEIQTNTDANGNMSVTAYNIMKTVELKGKKVWGAVPDSMLPQKLYVDIMREVRASGEIKNDPSNDLLVQTLEVGRNDGSFPWSVTLPAQDASGNEAKYYPVEQPVPGFEPSRECDEPVVGTITNTTVTGEIYNWTLTNTLITVDVSATKVWQDANNVYKTRPTDPNAKMTFEVKRRVDGGTWGDVNIDGIGGYACNVTGERVGNNATMRVTVADLEDAENVITFSGLPKYDTVTGKEWEYTIVESVVPNGYKVTHGETVKDKDAGDFSITITNSLKGEISGEKKWEPKPGMHETGYDEITLYLKYNGETVATTTATKPDYKWEFTGIPENLTANELAKFTVQEVTVPGYVSEPVTVTGYTGNEIVNIKAGASAELNIEKTVESAHTDFTLPAGLIFTFQVVRPSGAAGGTGPADGCQIVNDGKTTADFSNEWVTVQGASVKAVQKTDGRDPDFDPITINFTAEGTYVFQVSEVVDEKWSGHVKYDPAVYTVTYTVRRGHDGKLKVEPGNPVITKNGGSYQLDHLTFTNRYDMVNIKGSKLWEDEDAGLRLKIDAGTFKSTYLKLFVNDAETPVTVDDLKAWGATCTVDNGTNGSFSWSYNNLPAYDEEGDMITYAVKEMTVNGYQTFYANREDGVYKDRTDGIYGDYTLPENTSVANNIYNVLAKSELTIEKTVENEGKAQIDTAVNFTITPADDATKNAGYHFYEADAKGKIKVDAEGKPVEIQRNADGSINASIAVNTSDAKFSADEKLIVVFDNFEGESKTFKFIVEETGTAPAGWTYDDSEKTVTFTVMRNQSAFEPSDSLTMSQSVVVAMDSTSGGTASFTNTYKEVEKTSVTVKKVWHTAGGEIAPAEKQYDVTEFLELYVLTTDSDGNEKLTLVKDADGKVLRPVQQPLLKGEGTYDYTWSDLPKLKDGEQYVVKEDLEALYAKHPGYCANYDYNRDDYANAEEGYLVTNQVFMANVELAARKLVDGKMPELAKRFSFVVKNLTTNEEHIFKNEDAFVGEDNSLIDVFIKYGPEDQPAPGTTTVYEYVMYEVDPKDDAYIYDKAQFKFQATIDFNGKTTIKVWNEEKQAYVDDLAINAPAFTFNNKTVTSVIITKFWANETFASKDKVPNIADKLTLCKLVNGNPVKVENAPTPAHEATDADRSVYTWSGLPMYDENGNAIEYVVVEQKMPGYEQYYFGADGRLIDGGTYAPNGGAIDNEWQTTDVIITKVWVGVPPVDSDISNDLVLYANGKHVNEAPEKDGNRYAWYDLPEYDENGKLITYTVKESGIPGYVVSYEPLHVGEDADQEAAKDFAFAGETITNTYYETKGKVEFDGVKVLKGRDMKAGEFTFILTDVHGNKIQRVTNAADGSFTFDAIEFTADDVPYGESLPAIYRIYEAEGDLPGMTYDPTEYVIELLLTDNKAGKIIVEPVGGSLPEIKFVNTYEEKVYEAKGEVEFDGVKVLNGRDMKAGEFTFILTDKAGKELQRVTNAADGTFAFEPIKYTEKDVPYGKDAEFTYYITELAGNLPGVTYDTTKYEIVVGLWDDAKGTIHVGDISECVNEIVFTNTYEAEGSVTFKGAKFLLGREFKQGDEFTFELLNEKGDVIDTVTINPTSGTKADFAFKTIKYELADAGKTYTYTYRVKEKNGNEEGMTYDDTVHTVTVKVSDAGDGTLQVEASKNANALNFTNTYLAEGTVLFSGTKTMNGKALEGKDFTFVLTDADGKEIETVTNDKDGKIVFSAIQYKLEDAGKTFTYKVSEKNDGKKSVTYDDTVYTVTVKVEDAGNGHLKVTASDNATKLNFTNSYEAKAVLTMNAYKTVNGYKPSVNQVYDFVLLCDDGTEMKAQNKDEVITFGTIGFDEEDVGKTFIYTVKETTEANELLEVDAAIYQVAVTVVDNGDGNLKLETEILKDGKRANGVVFANTATATLAISKTVKGPGPDKAFDLKVTFIGVDGKELEGVYDYDGDVKGTITSGGVIALKDGQSVTIVGLPEGATYTVEENAGPAYTVTVNGKPIAKAEGTLVGHGKLEFINTVEVTTFSVTKVWEGTDLGEITLTLYADGKQITPQPEVTREGDKYTYYNLPKYNEEGEEIVYSAKERGIDGYIRIYNNVEPYQDVTSSVHDGGTIINREIQEEVHELSFKIHKVWTGVEATEEIPAITLTLYCNGEKLDVPTPKPDSEGWYRYYDLPKTVNGQIAVYTVVEEPIPGYTVTYKTASGEVVEEGVNGGEIINAKIPQTGDPATLGLWLALMGASAVLLTMLQRRRKA